MKYIYSMYTTFNFILPNQIDFWKGISVITRSWYVHYNKTFHKSVELNMLPHQEGNQIQPHSQNLTTV